MNKLSRGFILSLLTVAGAAYGENAVVSNPPPESQQEAAMEMATKAAPPTMAEQIPNSTVMSPEQFDAAIAKIKQTQMKRHQAKVAKVVTRKPVLPPPKPLTYEEGQQAMLNTVPDAPPDSEDSKIAFNALVKENMPMSPRQVVQLRQQLDVSQRASAITPNIPPKPVSSTLMINQAPGATPPAIRLAQGYVSSLVFVDSTGTPWPIASFDIGNPKSVNMQWDGKTNILLMQGVMPYISGDIVVRLVGLPTPITLELVSGQRVVDYRVDIHVSGIGPNTKELPIGSDLPNSASQVLLGVLDGIAPPGSHQLNVAGASNTSAWLLGEKMYLRTRFTLLSPGWVGKMVSPDGMIAYELAKTSTVLVSRYGEPVQLKVEGL